MKNKNKNNKNNKKMFRINGITKWEEDSRAMNGDYGHISDRDIQRILEDERVKKIDNNECDGLPFVCEAENEEEALEKYNEKYCEYDYLKAVEAECDEVRKFVVSLQVDCRVEVEVFAKDAQEAGSNAADEDFELQDPEVIDTHCVNAYDVEKGELTDLC